MNPTFHLYGMKITLAGDLTAARDRAHLARLLMFKTKLVNVNNLDIIQNNLRLNDGTHVHFMSQHGFDSATIYVPPKPEPKKPRYLQQKTVFYRAAFEVYDSSSSGANLVGHVICYGSGFNPPYAFLPLEAELTEVDPFDWGQWTVNYYEQPFSSLDDFLAHKLLAIDFQVPPEESNTIKEIPPSGTINSVYLGSSDFSAQVNQTRSFWDYICCSIEVPEYPSGSHQSPGSKRKVEDSSRYGTMLENHVFFVTDAGKEYGYWGTEDNLYGPPYYDDEHENSYSYKEKAIDTFLPLDAGASGRKDSTVKSKIAAAGSLPWQDISDGTSDKSNWKTCADYEGEMWAIPLVTPPFINKFRLSVWDYEMHRGVNNSYSYSTAPSRYYHYWSSAENENFYTLVYDKRASTYIGETVATIEGMPCTGPESPSLPYNKDYTGSASSDATTTMHLALCNEAKEVTEHLGEDGGSSCNRIRYYRDGTISFSLSSIHAKFGEVWKTVFFFAQKNNDKPMKLSDPLTLDGYNRNIVIPDVFDSDGNKLYSHSTFRLFKEEVTKVIKEQ